MTDAPRVSAGEAFRRVLERDPATRRAWEHASARLRAFGEAWEKVRAESPEERLRLAHEFADAIQEALRASGAKLTAAGFEPPQTIEDWEHLARIVEMPFETIRTGNFTYADVYAVAMAWIDRQKMKARLVAESGVGGVAGQAPPAGRRASGESDTDETPPPALTPTELRVLRMLATFDPSELASAARIEGAMEPTQRVSERSITKIVPRLIELGLAERPQGERSGTRLTLQGRRIARRLAE